MRVGLTAEDVSYWSSKNKPALEAVGVVAVLVVVKVSKTYAASDSFEDNGVEDLLSRAVSRWERIVDLPEPDSPLQMISYEGHTIERLQGLQENNSLVFGTCPKSRESSLGHVLGSSHGTSLLSSIWTLG